MAFDPSSARIFDPGSARSADDSASPGGFDPSTARIFDPGSARPVQADASAPAKKLPVAQVDVPENALKPAVDSVPDLAGANIEGAPVPADSAVGRITTAALDGAKNGWGDGAPGMDAQSEDSMRKLGIFPDEKSGRTGPLRQINEAVVKPLWTAGDALVRATTAGFGAYQGAVSQTGAEIGQPQLGRDFAAIPESMMGMPEALRTPHVPGSGEAVAADIQQARQAAAAARQARQSPTPTLDRMGAEAAAANAQPAAEGVSPTAAQAHMPDGDVQATTPADAQSRKAEAADEPPASRAGWAVTDYRDAIEKDAIARGVAPERAARMADSIAPGAWRAAQPAPAAQPAGHSPPEAPQPLAVATAAPVGHTDSPSGAYVMFRPDDLTRDPQTMQFKASDDKGVTGALNGVSRWEPALANPITVWQATDGRNVVVNGHQRLDLAERAQAAGQTDIQMPGRLYREADGYTPEYMRALGAYQNMAEGSGTAVDAAKVLRGSAAMPPEMRLPDLPPRSQVVAQGRSLAALSDEAFGVVANGVVEPAYAAHVGAMIKDPREQMAALDVLARANPTTSEQARLMVQDIRDSGFLNGAQTTLFGDEAFSQSLVPERARVLENAMRKLRAAKGIFKSAVDGEDTLTSAGNQLDRDGNIKAKSDNERLLDTLQRNATTRGPLSDALSDAARDLAGGKQIAGVSAKFLTDARRIVERGQAEGLQPGAVHGGVGFEAEGEAGGVEPPVEGQGGFFERADGLSEDAPVHSFDITPALRHAAQTDGMALFERRQSPTPDLFGTERAQPTRREADPTIRGDRRQQTMPGMEPSAHQAQAARDAAGPRTGQLPANEGLFGRREAALPTRSRWAGSLPADHVDETAALHPMGGQAGAASWVLERGRQTGNEHAAVVDNATGRIVHAGTSGKTNSVSFSPDQFSNPADSLTLHHKHPRNSALSAPDLTFGLSQPGISHIVAHGSEGLTTIASRGPKLENMTPGMAGAYLSHQYNNARKVLNDIFWGLIQEGKVSRGVAEAHFNDAINRLMQARGAIEYHSTNILPVAMADALRMQIRREGRDLATVNRSTQRLQPDQRHAVLPQGSGDRAGSGQSGHEAGSGSSPARPDGTARQGALFEGLKEEDPFEIIRAAAPRSAVARIGATAIQATRDLATSISNGLVPMRTGSVRAQRFAADFANALRGVQYRFGLIDQELERNFKPNEREAMGRAMDAQSVFEQRLRDMPANQQAAARAAFDAEGAGIAGLTDKQRKPLEALDQLSRHAWREMQNRGMVDPKAEGLPYYFPRQMVRWSEENGFTRASGEGGGGTGIDPRGGNLTTQGPQRREHLTPEETEAAARAKLGADTSLLRDIRSLPARLAFSHQAMAGVDLMNQIEQVGKETGVNTVVKGDIPGLLNPGDFFTMADHPAFRRFVGAGWQAVHVAREFEGPLRAVLSQKSPTWYKAAQALKGGVMSAIMFSPFIHLAVEIGRALPVVPGKILTLQALRDGSRLRGDLDYMDTATRDGLAPLGRGWAADPASIADQANVEGRTGFLRSLAQMRDQVADAAGRIGGQFAHDVIQHPHQTLLWDQVFNLQVGIYDAMRGKYAADGYSPEVAGTMAAHIANRYAGALPPEHLSRGANMAANLLLFSRSFTLGNLGVIKDTMTGAPSHVLARISQMAGPEVAQSAQAALRRKAVSAFVLDIGLFYLANGLLQAGLQVARQAPSLGLPAAAQQTYEDWLDKAGSAIHGAASNPLDIFGVLPQHWNEPGKQDRVYAGNDATGRGTYLRLPPGKVGEEFLGWFSKPGAMLMNKASPLVRPIIELMLGYDSLGRQLLPPNPHTIGEYVDTAGAIVKHIGESLGPTATIQGMNEMFQQYVMGKPTQADPWVTAAKVFGPMTGLAQVSSGYPGGPGAGEMHAQSERERFAIQKAMPDIRQKIIGGDVDGAIADMTRLGVSPGLQRYYLKQAMQPGPSVAAMRKLGSAPDDIQDRVRRQMAQ